MGFPLLVFMMCSLSQCWADPDTREEHVRWNQLKPLALIKILVLCGWFYTLCWAEPFTYSSSMLVCLSKGGMHKLLNVTEQWMNSGRNIYSSNWYTLKQKPPSGCCHTDTGCCCWTQNSVTGFSNNISAFFRLIFAKPL